MVPDCCWEFALQGPAFMAHSRPVYRLLKLQQQQQTKALYDDSPPPPRQAMPYPEGDVLYLCGDRHVVRHGNIVTKYTTSPYGMGINSKPNEALVLDFIRAYTTIPVPEVKASDWDRISMEYIPGETLKEAWPSLTMGQRTNILAQLSGYIKQLRALGGLYFGRFDGQGVLVPSIFPRSGGPFSTLPEFHDWLLHPPKRRTEQSIYWSQVTARLSNPCAIVFTHGDIAARNIIVRDGQIVALLDWETAGWYPEYWEYVFAMRGMDNIDWETLGAHVPSLFSTRYDLEFILVTKILSLSWVSY